MNENKPKTTSVGSALTQLLSRLKISDRVHEQIVIEQFDRIMGEQFTKRAKALKIESGTLFIEVTSSVWRQELFFQKRNIKERINAALGEMLVREIVFR